MTMYFKKELCLFFLFGLTTSACSTDFVFESQGMKLKLEPVVQELVIPWAFAFLPDGGLLITEKEGRILWHKKNTPIDEWVEVSGVPQVYDGGQGGLMDLVLHPQFQETPWVYLTYSIEEENKQRTTRVSRALWDQGKLKNLEILFTAKPGFTTRRHFGCRLVFDHQGYIFFAVGDRAHRDLAQSLSTHNGKVFRLYEDGRIPQDNPFYNHKDAMKEIWSYGHRNPQGIVIKKGELWINEHGPRGGDEINKIDKGKNYGWPLATYGKEYIGGSIGQGTSLPGMEGPKKYYIPSIAPSSMMYYDGDLYPKWKNSFFSGALVLRHLNRVFGENLSQEERLLESLNKRVRDIRLGPKGFIYVAVEDGAVFKIVPLLEKL